MKKRYITRIVLVLLVICLLSFCLSACGGASKTSEYEEKLQGRWIWKEYETNPIYRYLRFSGKEVVYGTNLFGSDLDAATWNCSYTIKGEKLVLTTDDGTEFDFKIKDNGDKLQIYDDEGHEYKKK